MCLLRGTDWIPIGFRYFDTLHNAKSWKVYKCVLWAGYERSLQFHMHIYSTNPCVSVSTPLVRGLLEGTTDDFKTAFKSFVNKILTRTGNEAWTWGTKVTTECNKLGLHYERLQPLQQTQSQYGVQNKEQEIGLCGNECWVGYMTDLQKLGGGGGNRTFARRRCRWNPCGVTGLPSGASPGGG